MNNRILLVEDSDANAIVYQNYLTPSFIVDTAKEGQTATYFFQQREYDLIILDVELPDVSGLSLLETFRESNPDIPVIVITAHSSVDIALKAMKMGANDFIAKPFDKTRLEVTVNNLLEGLKLSKIVKQYESGINRNNFYSMVGSSLAMQSVYHIIESAAHSNATVFITGESGTGKELCAEAIHKASGRAKQNFVALNCAAIPADLLESEIFGHVKGAFTGASSARDGAALKSNHGTLFLDEIGEMPLALQSKLLRFIQTGRFQPVGGNNEIETDIRFVCATNRDPLVEVKTGRFREDLYYRLNVIPILMPPLRERGDDVLLIASEFLKEYSEVENKEFRSFSSDVQRLLKLYPWPGNVRELSNAIRNIVVLNVGKEITNEMLPQALSDFYNGKLSAESIISELTENNGDSNHQQVFSENENNNDAATMFQSYNNQKIEPLWQAEKRHIENAINICNGNIPRAAAFLEVSPSTIYRKKLQWGEA